MALDLRRWFADKGHPIDHDDAFLLCAIAMAEETEPLTKLTMFFNAHGITPSTDCHRAIDMLVTGGSEFMNDKARQLVADVNEHMATKAQKLRDITSSDS